MIVENRFPEIIAELKLKANAIAEAGAETINAKAKEKVHVGPPPWHIKDELHVEKQGDGEYAVVAGDGEHVYYAHIVEFGSSKMSPRPFLIPAFDESLPEIEAAARAMLEAL